VLGQNPARSRSAAKPVATPDKRQVARPGDPATEKQHLDAALAAVTPAKKVEALEDFLRRYPNSSERTRAYESLTGARAALADEKFEAGEREAAVALFRRTLLDAPKPYTERFFREVVARIPLNMYFRGSRDEAFEAADLIEKTVASNIEQLLLLGSFYLAIESGDEAGRIATAALKLNPDSSGAFLLRANAQRINFDLEAAGISYARAYELDQTSVAAKRGLAEMKRALAKPSEAVDLYREILDKNPNDHQARTGLIMALFNAGKRQEAETEMAKAIELGTGNVVLISSAAYWYASQSDPAKAVELARKAVEKEPRYIWGHIALARGLMAQNNPLEAERVLINARKYGNFPTLEYEIANARLMSGFYREAASELAKSFTVVGDAVETRLGGRVLRRDKTLSDLIAHERRASIFEPASSDTADVAERLKTLLDFHQKLASSKADDSDVSAAADAFVKGDDRMKVHRQIFAANALVEKKVALAKALELTKAAVGQTDAALDVPNAAAAVMANELHASRALAFSRGEYVLIPDIPKQTLSAIMRGKIEEITGWALYNQSNHSEAVVRLRRSISVYPEKSAWWRSAMWRLGAALEAHGKDRDALDSYIKSYKIDKPDPARYAVIENLYRKLNGNTEGLEAEIGAVPTAPVVAEAPTAAGVRAKSPDVSPSSVAVKEMPKDIAVLPVQAATTKTDVKTAEEPTKTPIISEETKNTSIPTAASVSQPRPAEPSVTMIPPTEEKPIQTKYSTIEKIAAPETDVRTDTGAVKPKIESAPALSKTSRANRPLFEPIIITVPNSATRAKTDGEKKNAAGANKHASKTAKASVPPCTIKVGEETVSVSNAGGTARLSLTLNGADGDTEIIAVSSSPDNVEITADASSSDPRIYVIKSISQAAGSYEVTFTAPCGKALVNVNVR